MGTLIVGIGLAIILILALRHTLKKAKQGGCPGCSGGCKTGSTDCHLK